MEFVVFVVFCTLPGFLLMLWGVYARRTAFERHEHLLPQAKIEDGSPTRPPNEAPGIGRIILGILLMLAGACVGVVAWQLSRDPF